MQTTEIIVTVTIHKYERAEIGQARRWSGLRRWFAWLNPWTVAWYAFLTAWIAWMGWRNSRTDFLT